jgi:hypothetical protein
MICHGSRKLPSRGQSQALLVICGATGTGSHSNLTGNSTLRLNATRYFNSAFQLSS